MIKIMENHSYFSLTSLKIDLYFDDTMLSTATGFIIKNNGKYYLVTNHHVASGRHFDSNSCLDKVTGGIPNKIKIWHHIKGKPGYYKGTTENLVNSDGSERFINGKVFVNADIALLELQNIHDDIHIHDIDYIDHSKLEVKLYPGQQLVRV